MTEYWGSVSASVKMRELIPRQMFEVAIQAAIGAKVIARETVTAIHETGLEGKDASPGHHQRQSGELGQKT